VGDRLLPPSVTAIAVTRLNESLQQGMANIGQRNDRVYLASDRELARACAGVWTPDGTSVGGGTLYEVTTEHGLEPDDDFLCLPVSVTRPRRPPSCGSSTRTSAGTISGLDQSFGASSATWRPRSARAERAGLHDRRPSNDRINYEPHAVRGHKRKRTTES
jgi:hypothetical protein